MQGICSCCGKPCRVIVLQDKIADEFGTQVHPAAPVSDCCEAAVTQFHGNISNLHPMFQDIFYRHFGVDAQG